ncbi:MAG: hypothetical protein ACRDHL_06575 [Candidatus Promineifilaceae bacterium]
MNTLRNIWHYWKRFGLFMGNLIGRVILTIFYFTLFVPFGLGVRLFSDRLGMKPGAPRGWLARVEREPTPAEMRRLA